ncbi:hypothetical protein ACIQ7Q_25830 [Streptomyces sp. NPDC096176]|uniref:hypothetical protein n=1 Tax=Streptomyces sp. NPDC096176 TaxID=3366079 RepID=UPI00382B25C8
MLDPFGNLWWVTSRIEDVAPDVAWQRLSEPKYAESMRIAQETLDAKLSGRSRGWLVPRSARPVEPFVPPVRPARHFFAARARAVAAPGTIPA